MRTFVRLSITVSVFAVFYAGAFLIMQGTKEFEKRGEMALFSSKTEAAAIANAKAYEQKAVVEVPAGVWK